ncbi:serine/threonine protein kinase [Arthrobacter sp. PAMC25564]|uniref:serine/threonine-protein kinase n=1 Tax=Arthrobacter sp. PAMC25564 TaxID=2565366 RepID=UPI0010A2A2F6|nr:serine/threonine-protein kinase [Arthrobacter sp. PAMC25564]QCB98131.1 serine/threonine protein kinase [Arthrobacter sp. PAMC25564]
MEDSEQAFRAAPEVPGYDLGRLLGRGGNAVVWLVTEQSSGREFALKCFTPGDDASPAGPGLEEGIRREVRILSALDHEHLVKAHAVVRLRPVGADARDGLGLVLDYAAGGSLGELLAGRSRLGAGETVTVLTPVAQALAYLHGHGFTHGDVSPGNVLFTAHGKPLLADLGVARMVADAGGVAEAGTEGFHDPAPVDAVRAGLQPERDIYSLAALGWYCLTGQAPGHGSDRPPLPLLVPGVPDALVAALEAGLNEDRRQRPGAAEFAAAIYRSAVAAPVDLSVSVHPTVIPQLLTRRALPGSPGERRAEALRGWLQRIGVRRPPAPAVPAAPVPRRGPAAGRTGVRPAARHSGGSTGGPYRRVPARRRRLRAVSVGLALLLAAGGAVTGAWLFAGGRVPLSFPDVGPAASAGGATEGRTTAENLTADRPPSEGAPDREAAAVRPDLRALLDSSDPVEAVRGLARLRALAFGSGDFGLLEQVNVPGSSAAAADGVIRSRLSESGHVLADFSTALTRLEASPESTPARAVVAISAVSSAYQERDAAGAVVAEAAAGSEQRMRLVLVPVEGLWRIQDILPGAAGGG